MALEVQSTAVSRLSRLLQTTYGIKAGPLGVGSTSSSPNPSKDIPEAVRITMKSFEALIELDEQRRCELVTDVSDFALQHRLGELPELKRRMVAVLLERRATEIQALDRRIMLIRNKLADLRDRWVPANENESPVGTRSEARFSVQA
jgi:hypothetical protein